MSYHMPQVFATYRRKRDGVEVVVGGCTGTAWNDSVLCRAAGGRAYHVSLENFWKKYEPKEGEG